MLFTVLTPPTPEQEPIQVSDLQAQLRTDFDASSQDAVVVAELAFMRRKIRAAREMAELFCGRPFAPQVLQATYRLDEEYRLPLGAQEPTAVTGFFTDLSQLPTPGVVYLEEYRKAITINRELPLSEAYGQTFTVTVAVVPPSSALAEEAILELAAEWYKNRESSSGAGIVPRELPVSYRVKLAPLCVIPVLC